MRNKGCYFCTTVETATRLVNYKYGPTGKRGTYRRRICERCLQRNPEHHANIRGEWRGN